MLSIIETTLIYFIKIKANTSQMNVKKYVVYLFTTISFISAKVRILSNEYRELVRVDD